MTISAKIIADSISAYTGRRITTFELEYPRFIHAEFMTHRMASKNAASSRAIPVETAIKLILEDTAMPIHWGKNQPGMSAKEECDEHYIVHSDDGTKLVDYAREGIWNLARDAAIGIARIFHRLGYHKQIVNRLLEPFTHIKVVCTATDYTNFYWLRRHSDAQPEIRVLANRMWEAAENSTPVELKHGQWHTPYYGDGYWKPTGYVNITQDDIIDLDSRNTSLADALKISASQCAQVSYRKADDSIEKARIIYQRLVESVPVHASPFEHQGTPIAYTATRTGKLVHLPHEGITHWDKYDRTWSGNFVDWIQHRQLIPNNAMNEV